MLHLCLPPACLASAIRPPQHTPFPDAAGDSGACWADAALLSSLRNVLLPPTSNQQLLQWGRQEELVQVRLHMLAAPTFQPQL
jgi:hypothetical protein